MRSDFSDAQRAVAYVTEGLTGTFPQGEIEIIAFRGTHVAPRHFMLATTQARPVLDRLCQGFRGVSVRFTPEHAYGMVVTMESHPEFAPGGKKSKHPEDDPRVVILLRRNANQEVLIGSHWKPPVQPFRGAQV
jgi:hypothetical protein